MRSEAEPSAANFTAPGERSETQNDALSFSDQLVAELKTMKKAPETYEKLHAEMYEELRDEAAELLGIGETPAEKPDYRSAEYRPWVARRT